MAQNLDKFKMNDFNNLTSNQQRDLFVNVTSTLVQEKNVFDHSGREKFQIFFGKSAQQIHEENFETENRSVGSESTELLPTKNNVNVNSALSKSTLSVVTDNISERGNSERTEQPEATTSSLQKDKHACNQKTSNKAPSVATSRNVRGKHTLDLLNMQEIINKDKKRWIENIEKLNLDAINVNETKRGGAKFLTARKALDYGDFIVLLRGRTKNCERARRILQNDKKATKYLVHMGTLHSNQYMDTSGFPDWAGSFIKKDDINGNCGLCVVEINEKTHYCYFANQPIPKGATIYFAG